MSQLVVINLGEGSWQQGCSTIIIQLWEGRNSSPIQFLGSLPPSLELLDLYKRWRALYLALAKSLAWRRTNSNHDIELDSDCVSNVSKSTLDELSQQLKSHFNAWLQSGSFSRAEQQLRARLNRAAEIRVIIATENKHLRRFPWHLWSLFDDYYPQAEVGVSPPDYRPIPTSSQRLPNKQVKILAILGNSIGIDVRQDQLILEQLPGAQPFFLVEPERRELDHWLWSEKGWDILFFAGHSGSHSNVTEGKMEINQSSNLTVDQLRYALSAAIARGLKLAIFNSCDGLGLARRLADLDIPQIIVMRERVPDLVAQEFLKHFLQAFSSGSSLYQSVREARERLQGMEDEFVCASWLPVICQNPAEEPPTWESLRYGIQPHLEKKTSVGTPIKANRRLRRELLVVLLASLVMAGLVTGTRWHGKLQKWELQAFDFLMRQRPIEKPDPRLLVIRATEQDLERLKEPALSDNTILQLLKKLQTYKPQAIGLDIFREKAEGEGHTELIHYLERESNIFPACFTSNPDELPQLGNRPPSSRLGARMSFADAILDSDWVIRRHLLQGTPDPSSSCQASSALSFTLALNYLKLAPQHVTEHQSFQLGKAVFKMVKPHIGGYQWLDPKEDLGGDQILLNYRPYHDLGDFVKETTLIDALATLDNSKNSNYNNFINNKIVLIGYDDHKGDYQTTPYGKLSGVFIHAHMVSQILSAASGERSLIWWLPWWGDMLWIWGWSLLGGLLAWRLRTPFFRNLAGLATFSLLYGLCYFILIRSGWLPLVPSALALLLTSSSILIYQALRTQQRLSQ